MLDIFSFYTILHYLISSKDTLLIWNINLAHIDALN
jgi:hypothetical protein